MSIIVLKNNYDSFRKDFYLNARIGDPKNNDIDKKILMEFSLEFNNSAELDLNNTDILSIAQVITFKIID